MRVDVFQNVVFYAVESALLLVKFTIIRYLAKRESNVNRKWFPPLNKQGMNRFLWMRYRKVQPSNKQACLQAEFPKFLFLLFYSVLWSWYWSQQACDWNVYRWHVLVYLGTDCTSLWMPGRGSVSREENSVLTSFPGFSPTCPTSRREPWKRGWIHNQCFLYPRMFKWLRLTPSTHHPPPSKPKEVFWMLFKTILGKAAGEGDSRSTQGICIKIRYIDIHKLLYICL